MKKTLDRIFWFIVYLLPLLAWFVLSWRNAQATPLLDYVNAFSFPWIRDIFDTLFGYFNQFAFPLTGYLSYLVSVELAHCAFDIIVFIPRFCHRLVSGVIGKVGADE